MDVEKLKKTANNEKRNKLKEKNNICRCCLMLTKIFTQNVTKC
jgi:hypothetical protein